MSENTTEMTGLCPIHYATDIVVGKWKLPIICLLADGLPKRYGTIKRNLGGITNMMLSKSLKEMEANGIVHRKQYNEIPPKVEYTLTDEGKSLLPAIQLFAGWGAEHIVRHNAGTVRCEGCQAELNGFCEKH